MKKTILLALFAAIPVSAALAADEPTAKPKRDPAQIFKALDKDADGSLSIQEWSAGMVGHIDPARMPDVFKKKDADSDGKLSLTEFMFIPAKEPVKPGTTDAGTKKPKKEADATKTGQ